MKIGGHGIREHLRLLAPLFGLIAAVWALRLVLAAAGAPHWVVHYCSVTAASSIAVLFAVLLIYFKRFGGYSNIAMSAVLLELWSEILVSAAIGFDILAGTRSIFSSPEFARQMNPLQHLVSHLTIGLAFGSLVGTAMGCVLFWLLRKMVPPETLEKNG